MVPVWAAALVVLDLALFAWAVRRPMPALRALLVLLPVHSGGYLLASNVLLIDPTLVSLGGAWKEAIVAGLLVTALIRWFPTRIRPDLLSGLALLMLAVIGLRVVIDVAGGSSPMDVALGARQLAEWIVLFLAVRVLRPSTDWFLGTARVALPIVLLVASFGVLQPSLGAVFYDRFFHAPGELLHHAYLADTGNAIRLRAAGTFIAPNEFGLGVVILTSIMVVPLLATVRRGSQALVVGTTLAVCFAALLLSLSRSAWLGAAVGSTVTLGVFHRPLITLWHQRTILRVHWSRLASGAAAILAGAFVLFMLIGGLDVVSFTLSGHEASAAGRGASLAQGVEATITNPGGLSLGTAGPTALARTGRAVLTENWYLLYGIQLGIIAVSILVALVLAAAWRIYRATRSLVAGAIARTAGGSPHYPMWVAIGTMTALIAAIVGAFVIPALLDLPASLTLWASVATVIGWAQSGDHAAASGVDPSTHPV